MIPETASLPPKAVYVHVPFCLHHCGYCDFTVVANRDQLIPEYLRQLTNEFQHHCLESAGPVSVETIFLGGGTPTHLSPRDLQALLELIRRYFRLAPAGEFSIEANPDGLCTERLAVMREYGINRLSLGVQSFDDDVLKTLERQHSASEAAETVRRVCDVIPNVSLDLIFGVPGQTADSWEKTISMLTSLPVRHVSTYGLTYEQGTPFFRRERTGSLRRLPDEMEREMYLEGIETLTRHGFEHYEVSNFALPGFQCRHNQVYWNADEYFAFGPGAARYVNGVRTTNCRSVVRWLNSWKSGVPCEEDTEQLGPEDKAREAIMLALRMIRGLHVPSFEARFEVSLIGLAASAIEQHLASRLLEWNGDYLRLTREGLLIADSVIADFL